MTAGARELEQALDRLRGALGPDRVLDGTPAAQEIRRRGLNPAADPLPRVLLRPQTTEECRIAFEVLRAAGCQPHPIGSLTTFWEPHPAAIEIGLDTLGLRTPVRIDVDERVGCFGAGMTVREVDRLARARGLCLVAYPDSDGSTSVGSMAAMACTSGLGMARIQPVEQIVGLTVVTPAAEVVRTGASWRLGHAGIAHGIPDPTGLFLGSQGHFGAITEVLLTLAPAPFLASRSWQQPWCSPPALAAPLRQARQEMDHGLIDSLRLETVSAGGAQPASVDWFARCWAPDSPQAADARCAAVARSLGATAPRRWTESTAGRQGALPDHDERYSLPPGSHHERTGSEGFLGLEVNVNWGTQLDAVLEVFAELFRAIGTLPLGHRRLGIYLAPHTLSIGVQAMLSGGAATPDAVRDALAKFVGPLSALGALPYRPGRLWQSHEHDDPAGALIRRVVRDDRTP